MVHIRLERYNKGRGYKPCIQALTEYNKKKEMIKMVEIPIEINVIIMLIILSCIAGYLLFRNYLVSKRVGAYERIGIIDFSAHQFNREIGSGIIEVAIVEELGDYYKIEVIEVSGVPRYLENKAKTLIPKWIQKDKVTIKE